MPTHLPPPKKKIGHVNLNVLNNKWLDTFSHEHAKVVDDNGSKAVEVYSIHAFTQAIGYIKYKLKDEFNVMYRGQRKNYGTLKPTLYREANSVKVVSDRNQRINDFLRDSKDAKMYINGTPEYGYEPLLQHYGLNTRWIDLVDNHWIALWFGAQRFFSTRDGRAIHCETRNSRNDQESGYVYVVLVATHKFWMNAKTPGLYMDEDSKLIDLRTCTPSLYLRPHSQHAFLMARNSYHDENDTNLNNRIAGLIRIDVGLAKEWLGSGGLISSHSLFPPPFYDQGYSLFLEKRPPHTKELGTITNFYGST